jgi:3-hydroxybutyryl-CoA dehydrogenase
MKPSTPSPKNWAKCRLSFKKRFPALPATGCNLLLRETLHLVEEGIDSVQDVDRVLRGGVGFRYPWLSPMETTELGGLRDSIPTRKEPASKC